MKLEEYLESLKKCSDEDLTDELGVYDNFAIFLKADLEDITRELIATGKYTVFERHQTNEGPKNILYYTPGTVEMQVFQWIPGWSTTGRGMNSRKEDAEHSQRQLQDYNLTIMLHPWQEKRAEIHRFRAMAQVIEDVSKIVKAKEIPLCIPSSVGWKYLEPKEYNRIVYG